MQILRPKDAAERLGISLSSLYRWAKDRPDFPRIIKLGPRTSGWRVEDLDAWLSTQQKTEVQQ